MITHSSTASRNLAQRMAKVLAETVPELGDRMACRRSLAFAGFSDMEINEHMKAARRIARLMITEEIERRASTQWNGK